MLREKAGFFTAILALVCTAPARLLFAQVATPTVVAHDGMPVPGDSGVAFGPSPAMPQSVRMAASKGGVIAIATHMSDDPSAASMYRITGGVFSRVTRQGTMVDGDAGQRWPLGNFTTPLAVNDRGQILFTSDATGPAGSRHGLFLAGEGSAAIRTLSVEGQPITGLPGFAFLNADHFFEPSLCSPLSESGYCAAACAVAPPGTGRVISAVLGVSPTAVRLIATFSDTEPEGEFPLFSDYVPLSLDVNEAGDCVFIGGGDVYRASISTGVRVRVFDAETILPPLAFPPGGAVCTRINDSGVIAVQTPTGVYVDRGTGFQRELFPGQVVGVGAGARSVQLSEFPTSLTLDNAGNCSTYSGSLSVPGQWPHDQYRCAIVQTGPHGPDDPASAPRFFGVLDESTSFSTPFPSLPFNWTLRSDPVGTAPVVVSHFVGKTAAVVWDERGDAAFHFVAPAPVTLSDGRVETVTRTTYPYFVRRDTVLTDQGVGIWLAPLTSDGWVLLRSQPPTPACGDADFNNDLLVPDVQDIADFLGIYGGGACPTFRCDPIDFNRDGLFPDTADIEALLRVFGGGAC